MPNLVKFISTLLQKFHQKSCSLLEQGEATPPKISSRKNHQRPISFGRTPGGHCYCSKFRKFSFQCHLQSVSFSHAATVPLARSSPPLPLVRRCTRVRGAFLASVARWLALASVFCGVGTSRGGRQEAHHGRTPFRAAHRSLALRVASCTRAHARSTATVAGKHGTRSPPPTGPHPHRSVELTLNIQTPTNLTPKRTH